LLIWKKTTRGPHYMSMYVKNKNMMIGINGLPT